MEVSEKFKKLRKYTTVSSMRNFCQNSVDRPKNILASRFMRCWSTSSMEATKPTRSSSTALRTALISAFPSKEPLARQSTLQTTHPTPLALPTLMVLEPCSSLSALCSLVTRWPCSQGSIAFHPAKMEARQSGTTLSTTGKVATTWSTTTKRLTQAT